ncbi:MAG: biotin--[acetyl-CoA-carboxylase] ligase [Paludibacter sp.]|nr:biotin--[acetyl-CoA-carboxylase] ligase [Paludibacter sp.]
MYIKQTHSTNALLIGMVREGNLPEGFLIRTDFQTAGKGQMGNSWEAEAGKNLLFSFVLYPVHIAIDEQFIISQLVSVAIKKVLDTYADGFTVKWPNDIYYCDKKIGGILIENSLQGGRLKWMVTGVGLNINQKVFRSNAPNPVSLRQITGKRMNRKTILDQITREIHQLYHEMDAEAIRNAYFEGLYRRDGLHPFRADGEAFNACITNVDRDGKLELTTEEGEVRSYYFKEVEFIIAQ